MSVVPLTLTISLCLVFTFVLFFLREHSRKRFSSAESEALLPLADEHRSIVIDASEESAALDARLAADDHACKGNGTCSPCRRRSGGHSHHSGCAPKA